MVNVYVCCCKIFEALTFFLDTVHMFQLLVSKRSESVYSYIC